MSRGRIGIFGGTFNPPHIGHISAARECVEKLELGKLIMIPTNIPPHKKLPEGSASPAQRFEMTQIAASMVPMAEASDIEIKRTGASYTVDTVTYLKSIYPDSTLWLVIGTDMIGSFDRWYKPDVICSCCRLAAVARDNDDRLFIEQKAKELKKSIGAEIDIVYNRVVEGSSTMFREGGNDRLVPSEIRRYIRRNGLYGLK
ncbi:MAG: nicotinate (nicotinamide) nucleotide adenylyltransferase [Clostridia bacterium]|nr:nicotinate (nicotinamide) nucleotide adenylyltransferase [Clostridia bacterium]MBQ5813360.1 nicotinate (nicotinamide) nucleotide adenylyltransferase [Clostridia bacterium]